MSAVDTNPGEQTNEKQRIEYTSERSRVAFDLVIWRSFFLFQSPFGTSRNHHQRTGQNEDETELLTTTAWYNKSKHPSFAADTILS